MSSFAALSPEEKTELWSCLALRHCPGLGLLRANALITHYGSAFEAVEIGRRTPQKWAEDSVTPLRVAQKFALEPWRENALAEWQQLQQAGMAFVFLHGPGYPSLLSKIDDPPLLLYCRGDMGLLQSPMLGVVGSRDCTEEGIRVTAFFARALSEAGVTIVSGMAKGIDRAAHISALHGIGRSIAVLGTGADIVYPPSNEDLDSFLTREGLIISELPLGTPPKSKNFPARNRIISGLSRGILVVEASKRSGSLITARMALEQGRDVFAVPGHTLSAGSQGCQELIRSGAKPVFTAEDVLVELASFLSQDMQEGVLNIRRATERGLVSSSGPVTTPLPAPASLTLPSARQGMQPLPPLVVGIGSQPAATSLEGSALTQMPPEQQRPAPATKRSKKTPTSQRAVTSEKPLKHTGAKLPCERLFTLPEGLTPEETRIVTALQGQEVHLDTLCQSLDIPVSQLSATLVLLEMRGVVRQIPGMRYCLP